MTVVDLKRSGTGLHRRWHNLKATVPDEKRHRNQVLNTVPRLESVGRFSLGDMASHQTASVQAHSDRAS